VYGKVKNTNCKWICMGLLFKHSFTHWLFRASVMHRKQMWVANLKTCKWNESSRPSPPLPLPPPLPPPPLSWLLQHSEYYAVGWVLLTVSWEQFFQGCWFCLGEITCPCCYKPDAPFYCIGYQRMCSSPMCCAAFYNIKYCYNVNQFKIILCVSV
jgi:hypothetical protein